MIRSLVYPYVFSASHLSRDADVDTNMGLVATLLEEGRQEGRRQGRLEGLLDGESRILTRQLQLRFGSLPEWAKARLQAATSEQLETWGERILTAHSLEEVLADHDATGVP